MKKEYLLDILNGKRTSDVRTYKSPIINGKIALIESKSNKVYGYAFIKGEEIISYKDYIFWHISDSYPKEDAFAYYDMTYKNDKKIYYKYIFEKVEVLAKPYKEFNNKVYGSWVSITSDDYNLFNI